MIFCSPPARHRFVCALARLPGGCCPSSTLHSSSAAKSVIRTPYRGIDPNWTGPPTCYVLHTSGQRTGWSRRSVRSAVWVVTVATTMVLRLAGASLLPWSIITAQLVFLRFQQTASVANSTVPEPRRTHTHTHTHAHTHGRLNLPAAARLDRLRRLPDGEDARVCKAILQPCAR